MVEQYTARKRQTRSFVVALVLFGLCFYSLNPEQRTFQLQSPKALEQGERHRFEVPKERLEKEAGQGDAARSPALGHS